MFRRNKAIEVRRRNQSGDVDLCKPDSHETLRDLRWGASRIALTAALAAMPMMLIGGIADDGSGGIELKLGIRAAQAATTGTTFTSGALPDPIVTDFVVATSTNANVTAIGIKLTAAKATVQLTSDVTLSAKAVGTDDTTATAIGFLATGKISSSFTNSGAINAQATATVGAGTNGAEAAGVALTRTVTGDVRNLGTITASAVAKNFAVAAGIVADPGAAVGGNVTNFGTINVLASASIGIVEAAGIVVESDVGGGVANARDGGPGKISVQALGGSSAEALAILIFGKVGGGLTNSGTLKVLGSNLNGKAVAAGMVVTDDVAGNVVNTSSGLIDVSAIASTFAEAVGIDVGGSVGSSLADNSLINSGAINVRAVASKGGASAVGIFVGDITQSGNTAVVNTGIIKVTASATSGALADAAGVIIDDGITGDIKIGGKISAKAVGKAMTNGAFALGVGVGGSLASANLTVSGTMKVSASAASAAGLSTGTAGAFVRAISVVGNVTSGNIVITAGGKITANAVARTISGTAATITAGVQAIHIDSAFKGNFINAGAINISVKATNLSGATESFLDAFAQAFIVDENLTGTIVNSGNISIIAAAKNLSGPAGIVGVFAQAIVVEGSKMDGNFTNVGTIRVSAKATTVRGGTSGGFIGAFAEGFNVHSNMTGNIKNSGKITVSAAANDVSGIASDSSAFARGIHVGGTLAGDVTNAGTVKVVAKGTSGASFNVVARGIELGNKLTGSFMNTAVGLISVSAVGSKIKTATATGVIAGGVGVNLVNNGAIKAFASATDGKASNGKASAAGVSVGGTVGGNALNLGLVSAIATGATSANAVGLSLGNVGGSLVNSGTVVVHASAPGGSAEAVAISVGGAGNVRMAGKVSATAIGASSANAEGLVIDGDVSENLTNSGTLNVFASDTKGDAFAVGISVAGSVAGNVTLTGSKFTVSANGAAGAGVAVATGIVIGGSVGGVFSNAGTLVVNANAATATAVGIRGVSGGISLINSGIIQALANDLPGTAIKLGSANDVVSIMGGTITGAIDGGIGTGTGVVDTLNFSLDTGGVFNQNGEFRNFGAINVNSGRLVLNSDVTHATGTANFKILAGATVDIGPTTLTTLTILTIGGGGAGGVNLMVGTATAPGTGTGTPQALLNIPNQKLVVRGGDVTVAADGVVNVGTLATLTVDGIGQISAPSGKVVLNSGAEILVNVQPTGIVNVGSKFDLAFGGTGVTDLGAAVVEDHFRLDFSIVAAGTTAGSSSTLKLVAVLDNSYESLGNTPNAGALGAALDALGSGATGDLADLLFTMQGSEDTDDIAAILDDLVPAVGGGAFVGGQLAANMAAAQIGEHIKQYSIVGRGGRAAGGRGAQFGVWAQYFGGWADGDGGAGIPGYDADTNGGIVGGDFIPMREDEAFRLGFALAYSQTSVDDDGAAAGSTDVDSITPILYGSYDTGQWFVGGQMGFGFNDFDQDRPVPFFGTVATSSYSGETYTFNIDYGYNYILSHAYFLTALAGFSYVHTDIDGYTEKGGGVANQVVDSQSYDYFAPSIGVRLTGTTTGREGWTLQPRMSLGVRYDLVDDPVALTASLGGQTAPVKYDGYDPEETVFDIGVGFDLFTPDGFSMEFDYRADLADGATVQQVGIRVRFDF